MKIRHLNIEVTKRCNQHCFYCFNNSGIGSPASELTSGQWLTAFGKLKEQGLKSVHLTGGEPFAYPHAMDLLKGAQELELGTSILSNGFRVAELAREQEDVFRRLTVAQISLDSMNERVHNQRRGYPQAWRDATSAIRALCDFGVQVEVSCVASSDNIDDLLPVARFCVKVGANLIVRPIVAMGRATACQCGDSLHEVIDGRMNDIRVATEILIVEDRFHYVPNPHEICPSGFATVHHDGTLRNREKLSLSIFEFAA